MSEARMMYFEEDDVLHLSISDERKREAWNSAPT